MPQQYYDPMMMYGQPDITGQRYQVNQGLMQQRDDDLIKWIESPQKRIDAFVKVLSGKEFNSHLQKWEFNDEYLTMNRRGEQFWNILLKGMIDTDTILTRIDDEETIRRLAEPLMARAIINAYLNHEEYGMSPTYIPIIREIVTNKIILTLMRSLKQGERHFLNLNTTHEIKTTSDQNSPMFFGNLFAKKQS